MSIRSAAKAITIKDDRILLNKCHDDCNGEYYSLPGGGQHTSETLEEAIVRECLEETGYKVIPRRFVALFEEICEDPKTIELYPEYVHKMYHIFLCELATKSHNKAMEIDDMQIGSEWIKIDNLNTVRLLPNVLNGNMKELINCRTTVFLGSEKIPFNHG